MSTILKLIMLSAFYLLNLYNVKEPENSCENAVTPIGIALEPSCNTTE